MLLVLLAIACSTREPAPPVDATATSAPADVWTPSADEEAMIRALSSKDGGPSCEDVEKLAADPVPALVDLAEHVTMPPGVAIRAADCLARGHADAASDQLRAWVVTPETKGLALVVLDDLDAMPEPVAVDVAKDALAGPLAASARPRIARASRPSVASLVTP